VVTEITSSYDVRKSLTDLGGVPLLIEILSDQARELQILAAQTIANVARIRKARMIVRKCGGIPKIVSRLLTYVAFYLYLHIIIHLKKIAHGW